VVDDEVVNGDIEGEADFAEPVAPLARPVGGVGAAEEVVPDVLRLPEVDFHGEGAEGFGDGEGFVEGGEVLRGLLFGGGLEADHGALHALVGGVAEEITVEGDVVDLGASEEAGDLGGVEGFGLECAAEAGVDGEAGGQGESWWGSNVGISEEIEQGGVLVVDADERAFDFGEGLVEDVLEDAVLLVGEERGEGVEGGVEEAVDEANELGKVGVADGVTRVGDEGFPRGNILRGVAFDGGGEVLIAEVKDGEADVFALLGDAGAEGGATDGEATAAGGKTS
jgi:hypothetical protein